MSSIDNLKGLLNQAVNVGGTKLRAVTEPNQQAGNNLIMLFYNGVNSNLKLGKTTQIGAYVQGVQIAVKHTDYNKARTGSFSVLEFLSTRRDTIAGVYFDTRFSSPQSSGMDESGGHIWSFEIDMKGDK